MPHLVRPDGAELWWDEAGEGPAILICNTFNLAPVATLVAQLAPARRVITYEPRGVGRSTHSGPYDLATGAADIEAVLETNGPAAVAFAIGDGTHRALQAAQRRPDLIDRVVYTSSALGRLPGASGFSGSSQVLEALMSLMRRDYRTGLRSMVTGSQDGYEEGERDRVEELATAIPQEAAIGYLGEWIRAESVDLARELGARLTIMAYAGNAWFPLEMYEDASLALPEAEYELVEDGPMNRPDEAAGLLLRVSEPATG